MNARNSPSRPRRGREERRGLLRPLPALLVALLLGGALGTASAVVPGHHPATTASDYPSDQAELARAAASTPGDRVRQAITGVERTGLHVAPEVRSLFTAAQLRAIQDRIAGSAVPLHVVYWAETSEGGYSGEESALYQIIAHAAEPGVYAVASPGRYPTAMASDGDTVYVEADGNGRPAAALERLVGELSHLAASDWMPEPASGTGTESPDSDFWGGPVGGFFAGLLFAALVYGATWLVIAVVRVSVGARRG
ncbi:hypothetical protein [Nocardioides insulae]|uniref:hypothetical protein n=1 Tax=Nocardioides insulae TaxID=394734 RepID=UPI00041C84C6|nr:hypothetical protein [Nocardioides insulae]